MVKKLTFLISLFFLVFSLPQLWAYDDNFTIDTLYGQSPLNMGYAWNYAPVEHPIKQSNPADCKPFAVGNLSSGNLSLQVGLPAFSSGVDVYLAIQVSSVADGTIFLIDHNNNILPVSTALPPWKTNVSTVIDESLYGDIPIFLLPSGLYNLYLVVIPAGETDFTHYYFWSTSFNMDGTIDTSGAYKITNTVDATDCGEGIYTYSTIFYFTQNGNNIRVSGSDYDGDPFVLTGTLNGNRLSVSGSYKEDSGTTNLTANLNVSGSSFNGSISWTWSNEYFSCSGSDEISGIKQ